MSQHKPIRYHTIIQESRSSINKIMNEHSSARSFLNERLNPSIFPNDDNSESSAPNSCNSFKRSAFSASQFSKVITKSMAMDATHGHTRLKIGDPVRSRIHKQSRDQLVVGWVTTSES